MVCAFGAIGNPDAAFAAGFAEIGHLWLSTISYTPVANKDQPQGHAPDYPVVMFMSR